jgi:hypothetical protein
MIIMCLYVAAGGWHAETVFRGNTAVVGGGDIYADSQANVRLFGARLQGASAYAGGSLTIWDNATILVRGSQIVGASTTNAAAGGGCVGMGKDSTLLMIDSKLSGCNSPAFHGGALAAVDRARVTLLRSNITNSTAGTRAVVSAAGGAVRAIGAASVNLTDSHVTGNTANYGAGVVISDNATLKLVGSTVVAGNTAWDAGGGVVIASDAFSAGDLGARVTNNSARLGRDIFFYARHIAVVGSSNNTDAFIPSADSQGGLLHVTLNVTGPHGSPSDADIVMALVDNRNMTRFTQTVSSTGNNQLTRDVAVKIRQPPGTK